MCYLFGNDWIIVSLFFIAATQHCSVHCWLLRLLNAITVLCNFITSHGTFFFFAFPHSKLSIAVSKLLFFYFVSVGALGANLIADDKRKYQKIKKKFFLFVKVKKKPWKISEMLMFRTKTKHSLNSMNTLPQNT